MLFVNVLNGKHVVSVDWWCGFLLTDQSLACVLLWFLMVYCVWFYVRVLVVDWLIVFVRVFVSEEMVCCFVLMLCACVWFECVFYFCYNVCVDDSLFECNCCMTFYYFDVCLVWVLWIDRCEWCLWMYGHDYFSSFWLLLLFLGIVFICCFCVCVYVWLNVFWRGVLYYRIVHVLAYFVWAWRCECRMRQIG